MNEPTLSCFHCREKLIFVGKPSFREACPHCQNDVHVCRNCKYYDPMAYNECHETNSDRVVDKEKANFCEWFVPRETGINTIDPSAEAKEKLAQFFRKEV